jgi:hypothetical protein
MLLVKVLYITEWNTEGGLQRLRKKWISVEVLWTKNSCIYKIGIDPVTFRYTLGISTSMMGGSLFLWPRGWATLESFHTHTSSCLPWSPTRMGSGPFGRPYKGSPWYPDQVPLASLSLSRIYFWMSLVQIFHSVRSALHWLLSPDKMQPEDVCVWKDFLGLRKRDPPIIQVEIPTYTEKLKLWCHNPMFQPLWGARAKNAGMCLSSQYAIQVIYNIR